ncbi:MAG: glutamate racemase [Campylobacterota bacterium]|nr:glutamate racemase [Campylobacterota bacterium]
MKKAGVFDSGVGGLSVTKSLLEHNCFEEIIYFGDTARVPYGIKDKNTVIRYSLEALEFFKNFDIDILIVACNTASAYALEDLKRQAPFEVVGVIEPGILALQNKNIKKNSSIAIFATSATINSKTYHNLLHEKNYINITSIATPLFVSIVEEELNNTKILQEAMKHYFKELIEPPEAIILGCTHFPLISKEISSYFKNQSILIHSGEAIVEHLQTKYNLDEKDKKTEIKFFASENPDNLKKVAKNWLNI